MQFGDLSIYPTNFKVLLNGSLHQGFTLNWLVFALYSSMKHSFGINLVMFTNNTGIVCETCSLKSQFRGEKVNSGDKLVVWWTSKCF